MIRIPAIAALTVLALALPTQVQAETSRSIEAPSFTSVRADSALNVNIVVGGPQSVAIAAANTGDLDDLRWSVVGGELHVWTERDFWDVVSFHDSEITFTVSVPSHKGLNATSATRVTAKGVIENDITIKASSSASIVIDGITARHVGVEAASTGQISLSGSCETIDAASAGQSIFYASGLVTADVVSAAKVSLFGDPQHVDDDLSSAGDVDIVN